MSTVFETGPYLAVATLCDKAMQEADGTLSVIRIIDKLTQTAVAPDPPAVMPPTVFNTNLVVVLRGGEARGRFTLKMRIEKPSGEQVPLQREVPVTFAGAPEAGVNVLITFSLGIDQEGLWWIDVLLDENLLTRIPLRVVYSPQRTP